MVIKNTVRKQHNISGMTKWKAMGKPKISTEDITKQSISMDHLVIARFERSQLIYRT